MSKKFYSGGEEIASKEYVDVEIGKYETIPTASEDFEGRIIQYIGATDNTYTNGYFYTCVSNGEDPATYSWEQINVQPDATGKNINIVHVFQGYPDDSVQRFDFTAMDRGVYVLGPIYSYREGGSRFSYFQKDGTSADVPSSLSDDRVALKVIYITKPIQEAIDGGQTTGKIIFGSVDVCNLNDGTMVNRRLKYNTSDGVVELNQESKTPVIKCLTPRAQTFDGVKTFSSIPQVSSYTVPTSNTQLTAKKYVDDKIAAIPAGVEAIQVPITLLDITPGMTSEQIVQCLGGQSNVNKILDAFGNGKPIFGTAVGAGSYVQVPLTATVIDASGEGDFIFFGTIVENEVWEMNLNYNGLSGWTALSVTRTPLIKATTIAPLYNETSTYNVDDYCIYRDDGQLYKCTTAITVAEPFNVAHWTQTTIMGEFSNIINGVTARLSQLTDLPVQSVQVVNQLPQNEEPDTLYFVEDE